MASLTQQQISRLEWIIKDHMGIIAYITTGEITPDLTLIKQLGLPSQIESLIDTAYKYGRLSKLSTQNLDSLTQNEINNLLDNLEISPSVQKAMLYSRTKAQYSINTLQQRAVPSTITPAVHSTMRMWETISQTIPKALKDNTPRHQVIQQLRNSSNDIKRDWHRIAKTEMWDSKLVGEALAVVEGKSPFSNKKLDTLVYKKPSPDACLMCKKLYLETDGKTPKVFKLSELMANGSNYGVKRDEWKPVLGVMHPNCICTFNIKPEGTEFDKNGNLVVTKLKNPKIKAVENSDGSISLIKT